MSVIKSAKTVEEAVKLALNELTADIDVYKRQPLYSSKIFF